jgi:adenylate kinase
MMNLVHVPTAQNPIELQQQFFYPSVYFPDADEGSVVDMLQDRADQNDKILAAMHKTEFDPDTEMIEPDYNNEDMIVDDEGPDGPMIRDEYTIVQPLETEPEVTAVDVDGWGVHYDVEDYELPPRLGTETFEGEWGTETVTTSIVGEDGSPIAKAAPAKAVKKQVKKPAAAAPVAVKKTTTKKEMAKKSAAVVKAAKVSAAAVQKRRAVTHKKATGTAAAKKNKTLHAKVLKKIVRKRGVAKGPAHISAAKAAIRDKFRVVKAKKSSKKAGAKKAPAKLASHKKTLSKVQLKKVAAPKKMAVKKTAVKKSSKAANVKKAIQKKFKTIKVTKKGKH